jgi:hypothetical protein
MPPPGMRSSALHGAALLVLSLQRAAGFLASNAYAVRSFQIIHPSSGNAHASSSQLRMVLAEAPALESMPALEKKPVPSFGETGA